jgi:hypothetical protein
LGKDEERNIDKTGKLKTTCTYTKVIQDIAPEKACDILLQQISIPVPDNTPPATFSWKLLQK